MVGSYFQDEHKDITLDKFKVIAKNVQLEKYLSIVLSGAGEPLLNPDTLPILAFMNQKYPKVKKLLSTNGIALTQEKADELSLLNVDMVTFSVNAGSPDTYYKTMQVDCFDKVAGNIKYYNSITSTKQTVTMSFVAHRKNIADLPAFVQLAKSLGIKGVGVRYAKFYPQVQRQKMATCPENMLEDTDSLYYHQELSDYYFIRAKELCRKYNIQFIHACNPLFSEGFKKRICWLPFTDILVGLDGEVFPCCGGESIFKEKIESGEYDFGNLLKQRLQDFHNNADWQAIRYSALHPDDVAVPECAVCSIALSWKGHTKKAHIMEWAGLADKHIDYSKIKGGLNDNTKYFSKSI